MRLEGKNRYEYFVKKVADERKLWGLRGASGWMLVGTDEGQEALPVWPHERFALLCATGDWSGYSAEPIDLDGWLSRWIVGLEKDNRLVAVFPIPQHFGVAVDPRRLERDLNEELSCYE